MPRLVVVGDAMLDVTARTTADIAYASDTPARISMQPGGAAANTAAWAGHSGFDTVLIASVGDDMAGTLLAEHAREHNVDAQFVVHRGGRTGTCIVVVHPDGQRTMLPDSGANASLTDGGLQFTSDDHVHISGYALFHETSRVAATSILHRAHAAGATTSLDPASRAPLQSHVAYAMALLPAITVLLANEDEASVLTGLEDSLDAVRQLALRVPVAVVKRGGQGVVAAADGYLVEQEALPCDVVDTTGAGDAFAAGFLPAWRAGRSLGAALHAGQSLAASAVARVGAGPSGDIAENDAIARAEHGHPREEFEHGSAE